MQSLQWEIDQFHVISTWFGFICNISKNVLVLYLWSLLFNKGWNDAARKKLVIWGYCTRNVRASAFLYLLRKEGALLGNSRRKEILSGGPLSGMV